MAETPPASRWARRFAYLVTVVVVAAATVGVMILWQNIADRKEEAKQHVFRVVAIDENTINPGEWGKNFPRQFDTYKRTVDIERTRHGGSDAFQKLDEDPRWRILFKGYGFGVDYREERGHAYMLLDQDMTERVKQFKQPGACLHCHSSILPAYRHTGRKAGIPDKKRQEQIMKGFELVGAMPYAEARNLKDDQGQQLVEYPVSCIDCHDPDSMQLRVSRPGFLNGIRELAKSHVELPHLPSIARWRKEDRKKDYDVNAAASRQEMRSLVCAQCHVEYYFKGEGKLLTYPWHKGIKVEQIEAYYNEVGHVDWTHSISGAGLLKAQHPEFEFWSQGIHARSGVACADCHMSYKREGAIKISDHHVRSPLLNITRACQTCHRYPETEILARAEAIQNRTKALMIRAEAGVVDLINAIAETKMAGVAEEKLQKPRSLHRQAQWRLDFVAAENSMGFHAPQEAARILAEAIDLARLGQVEALKAILGNRG
jgi:nitrite reductase (cytochrome c-552)